MYSGLALTLSTFVRLMEPNIKDAFVNYIRRFLCCKAAKASKVEGSLSSFLNSSINIEYVYLILTGMEKVMKQRHYQI